MRLLLYVAVALVVLWLVDRALFTFDIPVPWRRDVPIPPPSRLKRGQFHDLTDSPDAAANRHARRAADVAAVPPPREADGLPRQLLVPPAGGDR